MTVMQPFYRRTGQILLSNPKGTADFTKVFIALPPLGIRRRLQFQPLIVDAVTQSLTVDSVVAGPYTLARGLQTATILVSVGETVVQVRDRLLREINRAGFVFAVASGTDSMTLYGPVSSTPLTVPDGDLTLGAVVPGTDVPLGSTTIPLSFPLTEVMQRDQFLTFRDSTGTETLVQLNAPAAVGDTTLIVRPLRRTLLAGAISEFPAYVTNLTDASFSTSGNKSTSPDYNTDFEDGVVVTRSGELSLPLNYTTRNAGAETLWYASEKKLEVFWIRQFDPPEASFEFGLTYYGHGVVTTANDNAPTGGTVTQELTLSFNEFFRLPPI